MKKQTGIWIDGSRAVIITFSKGSEFIIEIKSDIENPIYHNSEGDKGTFMGNRHINSEKRFSERRKQQTEQFLKSVVEEIEDTDELYVFGPAEMKTKLKKEIAEITLHNKLKAVETASKMTTNQMVAKVKKYYNL